MSHRADHRTNAAGGGRRRVIAVVGGGVTGLAAAHRVREAAPDAEVVVLEQSESLGGAIRTTRADGFLFEDGPDNFVTNVPWGVELCRRLALTGELQETNPDHRRAFVVRKGRLRPIPPGFLVMAPTRLWPVVATPILSPWGKLRLGWEYFTPPRRDEGDESLADFARRRFGREVYERLVQPLVCSIYTADPERLSIQATMDRFVELERRYGGLIRGVRRRAAARSGGGGARYSLFVTLRGGLRTLIDALAERLPPGAVRTGRPVRAVRRAGNRWRLELAGDGVPPVEADAVILAAPAWAAADLLDQLDSELAGALRAITYNSCALVSLAYRRGQIRHPLDGFGYVTPIIERRQVLSGSFSSVKYPGRAPEGHVLIRVFIGGGLQPELVDLPDARLEAIAERELKELLHAEGPPEAVRVWRSVRSMPQYEVGHLERVARIERLAGRWPGLALAGNAYRGVGIPHCVRSAWRAGEAAAGAAAD